MAVHESVLFIGAGYVGQNILDELLAAKYPVTTFVRRPEQAAIFESSGAQTVLGSLSDLELITAQVAQHEITINTASADDLPSVEAILAGVRQRVKAGLPSIYLHTSGAGAVHDDSMGAHNDGKIYRDDTPTDIEAIPSTNLHRNVDIAIVEAAHEFGDTAKIVIMLPALVYGYNPAHKRHTQIISLLVRFALKRGFAGYVGEGRNLWAAVHVKDLARAFMTVLEHTEKAPPGALVENPYFFAEGGTESSMKEVAEHLAQTLHDIGRIPGAKAQSWSESDYAEVLGPMTAPILGCNARCQAIRLRELGWKPTEKDMWTSWKEDSAS
ncbi:NAD(P)-binding protein [Microthyrium microscopicum]|uniref:NAD(P)-binding protein n=1 Tax=Microthyrium microscopicum TaxID=703497 RepID=A0A6A6UW86_9PEZI|nr:NAD(P)-binding protein [Microthyrium microscopicum]